MVLAKNWIVCNFAKRKRGPNLYWFDMPATNIVQPMFVSLKGIEKSTKFVEARKIPWKIKWKINENASKTMNISAIKNKWKFDGKLMKNTQISNEKVQ